MSGPRIVYCSNNHIYDSSLYSECPYCKKVAQEQSVLAQRLEGLAGNNSAVNPVAGWQPPDTAAGPLRMPQAEAPGAFRMPQPDTREDDDNDATELLMPGASADDDHDATELLMPGASEDDDNDATELLMPGASEDDDATELLMPGAFGRESIDERQGGKQGNEAGRAGVLVSACSSALPKELWAGLEELSAGQAGMS